MWCSALATARVDLDPEQIVGLHGARHLQEALGFEVEVEIDQDVDVRAGALAKGGQLIADRAEHVALGIELGEVVAAGEAGRVQARTVVEQEDVGLERRVALGDHLPAGGDDVVERAQRRDLHRLGPGQAIGAAVRPVEADALAHRAAEQLVDGHAERLGLDVQKRVLDRADRLLDHAAARLAADRVEQRDHRLVGPRVHADDRGREVLDRGGHALAAERLVVLAPADQALIGADLEEVEAARPGIGVQAFERVIFKVPLLPRMTSCRQVAAAKSQAAVTQLLRPAPSGQTPRAPA